MPLSSWWSCYSYPGLRLLTCYTTNEFVEGLFITKPHTTLCNHAIASDIDVAKVDNASASQILHWVDLVTRYPQITLKSQIASRHAAKCNKAMGILITLISLCTAAVSVDWTMNSLSIKVFNILNLPSKPLGLSTGQQSHFIYSLTCHNPESVKKLCPSRDILLGFEDKCGVECTYVRSKNIRNWSLYRRFQRTCSFTW